MIFSPSLWVVPKLKIKSKKANLADTKIYLYGGAQESVTMVQHMNEFKQNLISSSFIKENNQINLSINSKGKHSETYWSDEFPKAIEWLFFHSK